MDHPEHASDDDIAGWLTRFQGWLPDQGPLQVFVHHNPLHHFEGKPFHDACMSAAKMFGGRSTFTEARYQALIASGRIKQDDVRPIAKPHAIDAVPDTQGTTLLVSAVSDHLAVDVKEMADAAMLRFLPIFLDEGSARWPLLGREAGFLAVTRQLAKTPLGFTEVWLDEELSEALGEGDARTVIERCLRARSTHTASWPRILQEATFATPGYAGMMARKGALMDYVAVRLAIEECALSDVALRLLGRLASLKTLAAAAGAPDVDKPVWSEQLAAYQDAYEETYIRTLMGSLAAAEAMPKVASPTPEYQLITCIDDRLESLRRHLEEVIPTMETFGFAGFFGVPIIHHAPLNKDAVFSCPAPVTPTKVVTEELLDAAPEERSRAFVRMWDAISGGAGARDLFGGFIASVIALLLTPLTLAQVFFPRLFGRRVRMFEGSKLVMDGAKGWSIEDRATSISNVMDNLALHGKLAPIVLITGHGSKSANNPFLSAYQCGACGGSRGGINARTFCNFANDPAVRAKMAEKGYMIPAETVFVPAEYDTSLDFFRWFDLETLSAEQRRKLDALLPKLDEVMRRNAKERSRKFLDVSLDASEDTAHRAVKTRAVDLSEPRPEYNHATVAACIVGPRPLTRGLFLDRRSFMVSYDPKKDDADGKILQRHLAAPVPVCAGILLEYYFSAMDSERFGSGTKLPHNVQALVGVSNGATGDLRTGLWTQTTEIHEPLRLVTVIYQEPELLAASIAKVAEVHRYCLNDWVHMFAWSPSGRGFFRWKGEGFVPYTPEARVLASVPSSLAACQGTRDLIQPKWIRS